MENNEMRYVIIGAGAIGGAIGGRLVQAGKEVVFVARGAHLDALRSEGLTLVDTDGTARLPIHAVAGPGEVSLRPGDVLVLAVKSQDTSAALETWASALVEGGGVAADRLPILCAQNGVDNERQALRRFAAVYGVSVWLPAVHLRPGEVVLRSSPATGLLRIGRYPGGADALSNAIAADFRDARFAAQASTNIVRWKYGKLLRNLGNVIDALAIPGPEADAFRQRAVAEAEAVLKLAGIVAETFDDASLRRAGLELRPVPGLDTAGSSTWQSLAKGKAATEADYLNGEIVLLGRLHNVPTPINHVLQQAASQFARQGVKPRSLPIAEIEKRLPKSPRRDLADALAP
jgi:2-dehydropantoate 2-reductase